MTRPVFGVSLAVVSMVALAVVTGRREASDVWRDARRAQLQGRPADAVRLYEEAARREPARALEALEAAARVAASGVAPGWVGTLTALRLNERIIAEADRPTVAQRAFARIARLHHDETGDLDAALSAWARAVALGPGTEEGHAASVARMRALAASGQCATALEEAPGASISKVERPGLSLIVARCLAEIGDPVRAIGAYESLIASQPATPAAGEARFELSDLYAGRGDLDAALLVLLDARHHHPNPAAVDSRVAALKARIERRDAVRDWGQLR